MSFPGYKRLGVDVDATDAAAQHTLGTVIRTNLGQEFQYILAAEALAAYLPVDWTSAYSASVCDATDYIYGVPQVAIADTYYGWALIKGHGIVMTTASMAALPIARVTDAGGLANDIDADISAGVRGETFAAEASTPAGVACILF
jgi:hypothetical protein